MTNQSLKKMKDLVKIIKADEVSSMCFCTVDETDRAFFEGEIYAFNKIIRVLDKSLKVVE